jgi:6-phosphogluconolactonase (cycloisomerase 2 family)
MIKKNKFKSILNLGHLIAFMSGCGKLNFDQNATNTVLSPARFAYVVNNSANSISMFSINASTGVLTPIMNGGSAYVSISNPVSIAVDPQGKYLYAVSSNSSNYFKTYSIDQTTGALYPIQTANLIGAAANCITIGASGTYAYVSSVSAQKVQALPINQTTGELMSGSAGLSTGLDAPNNIAINPAETYAYTSSTASVSGFSFSMGSFISKTTYSLVGSNQQSITIHPNGKYAYSIDSSTSSVYQFAIYGAGALTLISSSTPTGIGPYSITVDPTGRFVYTANYTSNSISMFSINGAGALTSISSSLSTGAGPKSITVDQTGRFVYVVNNGSEQISIFSIDQITGMLTSIGSVSTETSSNPVSIVTTR